MAYSELIKNFKHIRDYIREFYVYGFKSRDEFTGRSARSYDDERRRLESWLGDYMQFRRTPEGKNMFLSIDSREVNHNPLYKAWKARSFTDGDITLHFILFDIFSSPDICLTIGQVMEAIDDYLSYFPSPRTFDESTVRKKLKEYVSEGLLISERHGKALAYRRAADSALPDEDVLDFFSEALPCGVIGSFLLDKKEPHPSVFSFKHHYITGAMDNEILCLIFDAIREKRYVTVTTTSRSHDHTVEADVLPLKIMISVQSGRQYLMAYSPRSRRISSLRTDNIISVKIGDICPTFDAVLEKFLKMRPHMWGVSTQSHSNIRLEHVEFTVRYSDEETYIRHRLEREKRCGTVEHLDDHTSRFSADVYDASELIPWIRTFLCRICEIHFSDAALESQFKQDLQDMYELYGLGGDAT